MQQLLYKQDLQQKFSILYLELIEIHCSFKSVKLNNHKFQLNSQDLQECLCVSRQPMYKCSNKVIIYDISIDSLRY